MTLALTVHTIVLLEYTHLVTLIAEISSEIALFIQIWIVQQRIHQLMSNRWGSHVE